MDLDFFAKKVLEIFGRNRKKVYLCRAIQKKGYPLDGLIKFFLSSVG